MTGTPEIKNFLSCFKIHLQNQSYRLHASNKVRLNLGEHIRFSNWQTLKCIILILKKEHISGVSIVVQWKQIQLGTVRLWVQALALLSGLRIWRCCELWSTLQMRL